MLRILRYIGRVVSNTLPPNYGDIRSSSLFETTYSGRVCPLSWMVRIQPPWWYFRNLPPARRCALRSRISSARSAVVRQYTWLLHHGTHGKIFFLKLRIFCTITVAYDIQASTMNLCGMKYVSSMRIHLFTRYSDVTALDHIISCCACVS